ncbi:MAG TPA: hypothetical protein VE176_09755, partial [Candidatus Limnocylindrales bacterium]|nr:hypothetical protein [Candidatus Limnocylindrales bacterium]
MFSVSLIVRDAGEQDVCTVSNPAKISGKLPDKGSHETLPAKAFLITEVMAIWPPAHKDGSRTAGQSNRKFGVGESLSNANASDPALNVNQ